MKVLVIGGGNMGLTYAEAIANSKFLKDKDLMILDNSKEKTEELRKRSHFAVFEKLEDCVPAADVIFIAVKPYHANALMETMKDLTSEGQIFISLDRKSVV